VRFRKINQTLRARSDLAILGVSRPVIVLGVDSGIAAPLVRTLSIMLLCLTLTGATDAGASSGPVVGWGSNYYLSKDYLGQATPPDAVNGVSGTATAIAAGMMHSCAIQAGTGNVVCWGSNYDHFFFNYYGQATPPDAVNGVSGTATAIAAGRVHSCAIQAGTGNVVCWGGGPAPPNAVNGVSGIATAIAAGTYYSCAIQADTDNVICWGMDDRGQATPPDAVNGASGTATAIAAGGYHSCAIQAGTGNVVCWGSDDLGGSYVGQATPPDAVNGVSGTATAIAAGYIHSCAIQAGTGDVVCWGSDDHGQATPPDAVNGASGTATAIAAGGYHSCAIQAGTGNVVCWGLNSSSGFDQRCGIRSDTGEVVCDGQATPPDDVNGVVGTAIAIAAGGIHSLAIALPEPSVLTAVESGIAMLAVLHRRRRRSAKW
jgi:hypothetical protein